MIFVDMRQTGRSRRSSGGVRNRTINCIQGAAGREIRLHQRKCRIHERAVLASGIAGIEDGADRIAEIVGNDAVAIFVSEVGADFGRKIESCLDCIPYVLLFEEVAVSIQSSVGTGARGVVRNGVWDAVCRRNTRRWGSRRGGENVWGNEQGAAEKGTLRGRVLRGLLPVTVVERIDDADSVVDLPGNSEVSECGDVPTADGARFRVIGKKRL